MQLNQLFKNFLFGQIICNIIFLSMSMLKKHKNKQIASIKFTQQPLCACKWEANHPYPSILLLDSQNSHPLNCFQKQMVSIRLAWLIKSLCSHWRKLLTAQRWHCIVFDLYELIPVFGTGHPKVKLSIRYLQSFVIFNNYQRGRSLLVLDRDTDSTSFHGRIF